MYACTSMYVLDGINPKYAPPIPSLALIVFFYKTRRHVIGIARGFSPFCAEI